MTRRQVPHLRQVNSHSFQARCLRWETSPCAHSLQSGILPASVRGDPNQHLQDGDNHLSVW